MDEQYTLNKLITRLLDLQAKGFGESKVDLIVEIEKAEDHPAIQAEAPLGDIAYTSRQDRIKLLPVGF